LTRDRARKLALVAMQIARITDTATLATAMPATRR
jgi:hypothetical protein